LKDGGQVSFTEKQQIHLDHKGQPILVCKMFHV